MSPGLFQFGDLSVEGESRAGRETWFRVQPPGIAFDVGRGAPNLAGVADVFLSHGHLDHALGVPFLLSLRSMQGAGETRVHCPRAAAGPLRALVEAAAALENRSYRYRIVPLDPGDRVDLPQELAVEAFATDHVVPSLGYLLIRRKRRLAPAYRGLPGERIAELRRGGAEVAAVEEAPWLAYCGDTGAGVFAAEPRLFDVPVLLLECTFLGDRLRDRGDRYGHLHLEDLVERERSFRNEAVVLHHLSRRHRPEELAREIADRLPALAPRVHLLTEGGPLRPPAAAGGVGADG